MKGKTWAVGALFLAAPGLATAQGSPCAQPAVVKALKEQGDRAMDAARPAEALAAYQQAYAACRAPPLSGTGGDEGAALVYNLGRAHLGTGDYAQALTHLQEFQRLASPALRAKVPGLDALIEEQRARVGSVLVTSNVRGAKVRLREKAVGDAPVGPLRVNAGKAVVDVAAEGYRPFSREVEVSPGATVTVSATLTPVAPVGVPAAPQAAPPPPPQAAPPPPLQVGTLSVRSPVDAAVVFVDGQPYGRAPADLRLPPGSHRVVVRAAGYRDVDQQLSLGAGERRDVSLTPEKEGSVLGKWWFWTAIGVAVTAGATTAIVVATRPATGIDPN